MPGRGLRRRDRRRRRRDGVLRRRARRDRRRGRSGRPPGPACSSRSTPASPAAARPLADWPDVVAAARAGSRSGGTGRVTGIWSHFACSDEPDHPANDAQEAAFREALAVAEEAGLRPEVRHLANSAAAILRPELAASTWSAAASRRTASTRRPGTDTRPRPGARDDRARPTLALVKRIAAGAGVSYGHTWIADRDTTVGLVPVGYGDGRAAARRQPRRGLGRRRAGGRSAAGSAWTSSWSTSTATCRAPATDVVLFGTGRDGEPTAQDWAEACGTINYEIVTRIGGRMVRRHVTSDRGGRPR